MVPKPDRKVKGLLDSKENVLDSWTEEHGTSTEGVQDSSTSNTSGQQDSTGQVQVPKPPKGIAKNVGSGGSGGCLCSDFWVWVWEKLNELVCGATDVQSKAGDEKEEEKDDDDDDEGEAWDDDIAIVLKARKCEPSLKNSTQDEHQLCGIINEGSSCYSNSCIQMLYTSSALRDYFLAHASSGPFHTALSCLFATMQGQSITALKDKHYPSISADFFNQVFRQEAPQFQSGHQHDAQEYMSILLKVLHREVNLADRTPLHNTPPVSAQQAWDYHVQHIDNSFLSGLLVGQMESVRTCLTCRGQSRRWSCVWQLQVQVQSGSTEQRSPTLKDCINEYMADEILDFYCDQCGTRQAASKKQTMCRVPQALLIHLKRFTPNGTKIDSSVEIDTRLTLSAVPQEQLLVHSAILHRGANNDGHYLALFREDDNKWVLFDDDLVYDCITNQQASLIMRKSAYVVIYNRVTSA